MRIFAIDLPAVAGTVLRSTITFGPPAAFEIRRATISQWTRSGAYPAPAPPSLSGVLTETNTMSASRTAPSKSVEKKRLVPLTSSSVSAMPGS